MSDIRHPTYRYHAARKCAVVRLSGHDFYLGKFGSPESKVEYERLIGEWLARGRVAPVHAESPKPQPDGLSVAEVMLAYVRHADGYYRDADGQPTREVETMTLAFRPLKALYAHTPAADFGPLALEAVQAKMIGSGWARRVINQRIGYVRRMFRWASKKQLIAPAVYHGLMCVENLQRGRSAARETKPVLPVADAQVDAILPYLPPTLRAMVGLHRLTGMRSGELVRMRGCDIDRSGSVWLYKVAKHKAARYGRERVVGLGPQCQALLTPFLNPTEPAAFLFSPRQARDERYEAARRARKTRVQPSQLNRKKARPKRGPGEVYNTRSYYAAMRFAMKAAKKAGKMSEADFWHPHRLRHSAARRIKREQGLEAARAYLGHAKADMTEHYAGVDTTLAVTVAERCG